MGFHDRIHERHCSPHVVGPQHLPAKGKQTPPPRPREVLQDDDNIHLPVNDDTEDESEESSMRKRLMTRTSAEFNIVNIRPCSCV